MAQPELTVQIAILRWLRLVMPAALVQHSKNEHQKRGKAGMLTAVRNRSAGVMAGFPDLIVLPDAAVGAFFLEVKAPKGSVSTAQKQVHDLLRARGYPVGVVRSIDDTRSFLQANNIGFCEVTA